MRPRFLSNIVLETLKANGTQGRLLYWYPGKVQQKRKAVSASFPDLSCRFLKETSLSKAELLADIDFLDVTVRRGLSGLENSPKPLLQQYLHATL